MKIFADVYNGKRILVTGHTGFKGSWLSIWLLELGAKVIGYSLDPYTEKDNFVLSGLSQKMVDIRGDIRDREHLRQVFRVHKPEIVFHLAAQPLVRLSYEIPIETYETNLMGTINIMEEIKTCKETKIGILITTDKCYENKEQIWGYRENDAFGGYDPYSSSKGACEIAIESWRKSFFNPGVFEKHGKGIASVRAGNVIGGGDWAKDRIVPDCIRALEAGKNIEIRNPKAIRPWEHVLEPLSGYLLLGQKMLQEPGKYCEGWNFGPTLDSLTNVWEVANMIIENYGKGHLKDVSDTEALHEASLLLLDITKSQLKLGWKPKLTMNETIKLTVDWYRNYKNSDIYTVNVDQIKNYQKMVNNHEK
jgi:CDP-glucose 4,6-dehydratase